MIIKNQNILATFFTIGFSFLFSAQLALNNETKTSLKKETIQKKQLELFKEKQAEKSNSKALVFDENKGQLKDRDGNSMNDVLYSAIVGDKFKGVGVQVRKNALTYIPYKNLYDTSLIEPTDLPKFRIEEYEPDSNTELFITRKGSEYYRMDIELLNMNVDSYLTTTNKKDYLTNFVLANQTVTVNHFETVVYKKVWNGIDWRVFLNDLGVKHEFVVAPNSNLQLIKYKINNGTNAVTVFPTHIIMETPMGEIQEGKLLCYTINADGKKHKIDAHYIQNADGSIGIEADWDGTLELIIDPQLIWATYYGNTTTSTVESAPTGCTVDRQGNFLVSGLAQTAMFPTLNPGNGAYFSGFSGSYNAYILKFSSNGNLIWGTHFGNEVIGGAITSDNNNNVFVAGGTGLDTGTLPFGAFSNPTGAYTQTARGGNYETYLAKFSSTGAPLWLTWYGGVGEDVITDLAVNNAGDLLVTGYTRSPNFPLFTGGAYNQAFNGTSDAYILKFNNNGVRQFAFFYGGSGFDYFNSIATDASNAIYVVGETNSNNMPVTAGAFQTTNISAVTGTMLKFNTNGVRSYASYYGNGSTNNVTNGNVAIGLDGSIIITSRYYLTTDLAQINPGGGAYQAATVPVTGNPGDRIITKFNPSFVPVWRARTPDIAPGTEDDGGVGNQLEVDPFGNIYWLYHTYFEAGYLDPAFCTSSCFSGTPTVNDEASFLMIFDQNGVGKWDGFVTKGHGELNEYLAVNKTGSGEFFVAYSTSQIQTVLNPGGGAFFSTTPAPSYFAKYRLQSLPGDPCQDNCFASTPLPVEFLGAKVYCDNNIASLKWATESEQNNAYFEVFSSKDGIDWILEGKEESAADGNSTVKLNYTMRLKTPTDSKTVYKLDQVDKDGKRAELGLISGKDCGEFDDVILYPSATKDEFKIRHSWKSMDISIVNLEGKEVMKILNYDSQSAINIGNLPVGVYYCNMSNSCKEQTLPVRKL